MSVIFAASVAVVGLLVAFLVGARQNAAPSPRTVSRRLVLPGEVRIDDWLEGRGRVISLEALDNSDVLVGTTTELLVCRTDVEIEVLRSRLRAE